MIRCPFCQFENEEGALFCEQCKSDLAGAESRPTVPDVGLAPLPAAEPVFPETAAATFGATMPGSPPVDAAALAVAEPVAEDQRVEETGLPPRAESPFELPGAAAPETFAPPPAETAAPGEVPAAPPTPAAAPLGAEATPRLVVIRGVKVNAEYPLYAGENFVGRADEKPVDVDLEEQEPPDRIWSSRQHALIMYESGKLTIEDLNSSNGTFVNRTRVYPGQKRELNVNDVIQIGTVQLRVKA